MHSSHKRILSNLSPSLPALCFRSSSEIARYPDRNDTWYRHSLHVYPRRVQVTVSRSRGVHYLLRGALESNSSAPLHSRLRRDREEPARPRGVQIVMSGAVVSTPTCHVIPPWRHAQ